MKTKLVAAAVAASVFLIGGLLAFFTLAGHNDSYHWQVLQTPTGKVSVIDGSGYYYKGFGRVWTYPRTLETTYDGAQSVSVTFNDTGTAQVGAYARVALPTTSEKRLLLHQDFQGNPANITSAIRAHLVNCLKASGPVMSASENQSSRKAEFNQIVEEQLSRGLYKMRRTEIELNDLSEIEDAGVDAQGNKLTREKKARVQATEIVSDKNGQPIIIQISPLAHYDLIINQFSITETSYDEQTLKQFGAKKESYLNAEKSKAQRQEEVQQRLMVEEKGRRQAAEIEAEENQKKVRALIQAQQAAEVAVIEKERAVTQAKQKAEVATQAKTEAETLRQIAEVKAKTAELEKAAVIAAAQGKEQEIALGGGITEKERVLAEIASKRDIGVAEALSKIPVPTNVFSGGGAGGGNITESLINMALLKSTGILKDSK